MPVPIPNLDDRTFDDLVREGISLIPAYAPEWTNHNPSDPGITLVELLAYFTEMLIFRLARVSRESKLQFLRLLKGEQWRGWEQLENAAADELRRAIDVCIRDLGHIDCAVTKDDFERLAIQAAIAKLGPTGSARAVCIPATNLEATRPSSREGTDLGHVSVVIVPAEELAESSLQSLLEHVRQHLLGRSLLATRVHVIGPVYLHVSIGVRVSPKPGTSMRVLKTSIANEVQRRFSAFVGEGPQGKGWPFGRALHISELMEAIDRAEGVDYVEDVTVLQVADRETVLTTSEASLGVQIGIRSTIGVDARIGGPQTIGTDRLVCADSGTLVSILLRHWELLRVTIAEDDIRLIEPEPRATGRDARGGASHE
jgi:hypothetical protein